MLCGLVGALPMTGVIVRSAANVQAGGRTRWSAVMHGFWLLIFVAFLAFLLRTIPTACLAAMLVYTGVKLMNFRKNFSDLIKFGKGEILIYIVTVSTIVCVDLLSGVVTGVVLSALKLLYTFSRLKTDLVLDRERKQARLTLDGAATFLRLPALAEQLEQVPEGYELQMEFDDLEYIDHACFQLIDNWAKQYEMMGGSVIVDWDALHARFQRDQNADSRLKNRKDDTKLDREVMA